MQPLVIFGAGGLGRELHGWLNAASETFRRQWTVTAFVADDAKQGAKLRELPLLRRSDLNGSRPRFLLAVASPADRKRIATELTSIGWTGETCIHETVLMGQGVTVGNGTVICPHTTLSADCRIGRFVFINCRSGIGHDAKIGDYSSLLGNNVVNGNVVVDCEVLIGSGAIVHPKTRIGARSTIGIGSVVIRNVKFETSVFGNPARRLPR